MPGLLTLLPAFIFMGYAVDTAVAFPIPPSIKHWNLRASHIAPPEMIFYSVFTTALLFSIIGAYVLWVMRGARAPDFIERLRRGAALPLSMRSLRISSFAAALTSVGQIAQPHIPIRRGRVSYPVSLAPRPWAQAGQRPSRRPNMS